jgi:hypothetical protein
MDIRSLPIEEQIEYYLGKDRFPNLHWKPELPATWTIPPRPSGMKLCNPESHNVSIWLENIEYTLNNLGYRANFNFHLDDLKTKNLVLLLGDSDTFARGVQFDEMYATKMQNATDYCIVNLGIPGCSADAMVRIGAQAIFALGNAVKHVCVLWPVISLREFVSKTFVCGVHNHSDYLPYDKWWDHIDWVSNNYNYQKNKILIQQTVENAGAEYHDLIINRYDTKAPTTYTQVELKSSHPYTEFDSTSHTAIANYFLRKINNQPSLFQTMQS